MTYIMLSATQESETVIVTAEYTFNDNSKQTILVPIFAPTSMSFIEESVNNRGLTEQQKIDIINQNKIFVEEINNQNIIE
jgi:hypothetical protein